MIMFINICIYTCVYYFVIYVLIHKSGGAHKRMEGQNFFNEHMVAVVVSGEDVPPRGPKIEKRYLKNKNLEAL